MLWPCSPACQPCPPARLPARLPACRRFLKLLKSGTDPKRYGGSLYFAYGGDVTLTQQRYEAVRGDPQVASLAPWQRAAPSFFWNRALAQPLLGALALLWPALPCPLPCSLPAAYFLLLSGVPAPTAAWVVAVCRWQRPRACPPPPHPPLPSSAAPPPPSPAAAAEAGMGRFVPPAFMGFVGQIGGVELRGQYRTHTASVTLIARRSLRRAGCRQWRRGADLEAAVANFVESEQLVVVDGGAVQASYVQVGGLGEWEGWRRVGGWAVRVGGWVSGLGGHLSAGAGQGGAGQGLTGAVPAWDGSGSAWCASRTPGTASAHPPQSIPPHGPTPPPTHSQALARYLCPPACLLACLPACLPAGAGQHPAAVEPDPLPQV
jgi:hypothetical protein